MGRMSMLGSGVDIIRFVVFGGFTVMLYGFLVMLGCFFMMVGNLLRMGHDGVSAIERYRRLVTGSPTKE
jgi:hypothetical protein